MLAEYSIAQARTAIPAPLRGAWHNHLHRRCRWLRTGGRTRPFIRAALAADGPSFCSVTPWRRLGVLSGPRLSVLSRSLRPPPACSHLLADGLPGGSPLARLSCAPSPHVCPSSSTRPLAWWLARLSQSQSCSPSTASHHRRGVRRHHSLSEYTIALSRMEHRSSKNDHLTGTTICTSLRWFPGVRTKKVRLALDLLSVSVALWRLRSCALAHTLLPISLAFTC